MQHFELQLADDADDLVGADHAAEHLRHALLGEVGERLAELLGLDRIGQADATDDFGREVRDARDLQRTGALGQRVADAAACRDWGCRRCRRPRPRRPVSRLWPKKNIGLATVSSLPVRMFRSFMPRLKVPEASRRNATRSRWLASMFACTLKTKPETLRLVREDRRGLGRLRPRLRRPGAERAQQFGHAHVLQRRAEDHRRQVAGEEGLEVELAASRARTSSSAFEARLDHRVGGQRRRRAAGRRSRSKPRISSPVRRQHARGHEVDRAAEIDALPQRPDHRRHVQRQRRGDLVEQRRADRGLRGRPC